MSIKIIAKVWEHYPGRGTELLSMLALADWSDDGGRCFPSMASISHKIRLSRSQAQRVMHGLIDAGFVKVIENKFGGPPGATRQYQIVLDRLTGRTDATGSAHATGRTDAQYGSHGCAETGSTDATQTVNDPSITVNDSDQASRARENKAKIPDCPHQKIIELYTKHLATLPQPRIWEGKRADNLRARWRWVLTAKKLNGDRYAIDLDSAIDWFDRFFVYVAESDFLTGRDGKWSGCELAWLVKAENFAKVIEGKYVNRRDAA